MAGASMKAIKSRIKSVESTMQITKAMELVASSKLRRAKLEAENTRPFFAVLRETIGGIVTNFQDVSSAFLEQHGEEEGCCYIVIAGDRGLAGGYNNNLFRAADGMMVPGRDCVLPIGKKSIEHYARRDVEILTDRFDLAADVGVADSVEISSLICRYYLQKRFGRVTLIYTEFVNMLSQEVMTERLLPLRKEDFVEEKRSGMAELTLYEPSEQEVLDSVIPQFLSGMIYSAGREAAAAEQAARRTAMNSANKNAGELVDNLTLHYNRARQAVITQEITEIVAGAEAL